MSTAAQRWAEISTLFDEWVDLEPQMRERHLAELAERDPELAAEVRSLLLADDEDSPLLDSHAAAAMPSLLLDLNAMPADGRIGPYRLLHAIGEGGMGEVWLAERTDGTYEQKVAIKLLKRGMDTHAILRRFLQERRILARLHHPHIVRLIDGGMNIDGRPFYVMDFVDGEPVTRHVVKMALDVRARVKLLVEVADAVAYAHTQLVVHRDLKPSNVLVDLEGRPRVLDFGIAKLIEESGEQTVTGTGLRVMSPAYAAPEQVLGEAVGTATDVHALGLMLCELLTGQSPLQRNASTPAQLALDVSRESVDRASTLATRLKPDQVQALYGSDVDTRQLARNLSGDLDLIIATSLQREPARRYPTAAAMADDLRRWLERRPIAARADSPGYRMRKFVRRHRFGVAATILIACSLIVGLGVALRQTRLAQAEAQRADEERVKAERQLARTERVKEFILTLFREQDPVSRASAQARTPAELIRDGIAAIDTSLAAEPELQAQLLKDLGEIQIGLDDREAAQATLKRAWKMQSTLSGPDSLATAETLAAYANAAYAVGDVGKAESLLREALELLRGAGAGDLPSAALAESSLANIELMAGRNAEAERLARHGVEVFRGIYGDSHDQVASRLGVLGKIQQEAGKYADALESYSLALEIVARSNGGDHVRTALLRMNIGDIQRLQRNYDDALLNYETALRIKREFLPADHIYIGGALLRLGDLHRRMGNFGAAETCFAQSLRILAKTPSGQYAQALQSYAALARTQGRFDLAVVRYRQAYDAFKAATGDSVYTWLTALGEAAALTDATRLGDADIRVSEALDALAEISPDDDYNNTYAASVQGALRQAQGRHEEAMPILRRSLEGASRIYPKDHAEIAMAQVALASSLLATNDESMRAEAERLIASAIESQTRDDDTGSRSVVGWAYLERAHLHQVRGDDLAAQSDIRQAMSLLDAPEFESRRKQAHRLARMLGVEVASR